MKQQPITTYIDYVQYMARNRDRFARIVNPNSNQKTQQMAQKDREYSDASKVYDAMVVASLIQKHKITSPIDTSNYRCPPPPPAVNYRTPPPPTPIGNTEQKSVNIEDAPEEIKNIIKQSKFLSRHYKMYQHQTLVYKYRKATVEKDPWIIRMWKRIKSIFVKQK